MEGLRATDTGVRVCARLEDVAPKEESTKRRRRVLFVERSQKLWTKLRVGNAAVNSETRPSGISGSPSFQLQ